MTEKTYTLLKKIDGDRMENEREELNEKLSVMKVNYVLIVDENYYINQYQNKRYCIYAHYKNGELSKLCHYIMRG